MHLRLGADPWLDRLAALIDGVVRGVQVLATATLLAAVALNFVNIVGRYAFNAPIAWAEEVLLFMQVGVVFLGAVAVSREGRHIRMDVAVNLLPPGPLRIAEVVSQVVELVVAVAVTWLAFPLIRQLAEFDQRSQAAQVPLYVPQALVPLGFTLIAVAVLVRLARR